MSDILEPYLQLRLGMDIENAFKIESVEILKVSDHYFALRDEHKGYVHYFPYGNVIQIIESTKGIEVGGLFSHKEKFDVIIKIGHLMEYLPQ